MTSSGSATVTLPKDDQILITREFDAPRHLVYRAYTDPDLIRRWWAGRRGQVTSVEVDLRVGGKWRYVMVAHEGYEVAFHGEFREIVPNERLISTEVYEGAPDGEPALNLATFTESGDRTTLSILMQLDSRETRDAIIATGMESGMQEAFDILDEIAASLM